MGLRHNYISDISALTGLTNLARVDLRHNHISDIFPLVANTGLGRGDEVVLNDNPLSYLSIHTHVPALQSKAVTVEFDNRTPTTIQKIPSVTISSDNVLTVDVRDENGVRLKEFR